MAPRGRGAARPRGVTVSCIRQRVNPEASGWEPMFNHVVTGRGTFMPVRPRPVEYSTSFFRTPAGFEHGTESAW